jgi:Fe-S cluster assembly protein SufD
MQEEQMKHWTSGFERFMLKRGGEGQSVYASRSSAFARFLEAGFPDADRELWKYTNLSALHAAGFEQSAGGQVASRSSIRSLAAVDDEGIELVFVDGIFNPALSRTRPLPGAAIVVPISELTQNDHPGLTVAGNGHTFNSLASLNAAFLEDGILIEVPDRVVLQNTVHALFVTTENGTPRMTSPRIVIRLGRQASATVVEQYVSMGAAAHFTNSVTEITAGEASTLNHYRIQDENREAIHLSNLSVTLGQSAVGVSHTYTFGGRLVRNDISALLGGEGIDWTLNGLTMADARQHVDQHTTIDHAWPGCTTRETFRSILDGDARGISSGRIIVRPGAQKTDAMQAGNNLLLSKSASAETRPQLEILADDVRCSHGATTGRLDETALFYLRSRGIGLVEAKNILTYAFAGHVAGGIRPSTLAASVDARIRERFNTD